MQPVLIHKGNTYKTRSNQRVKVTTPSGKLVNKRVAKKCKKHRCQGCNQRLLSIASLRPAAFFKLPLSKKRVSRPYGHKLCTKCVSDRIVTAFLTEEEKLLNVSK